MKSFRRLAAVFFTILLLSLCFTQAMPVQAASQKKWSGEAGTYNTMVDSRELGHAPSGSEHLISYKPYYNYALVIGYNRKCKVGKGAAIFMHCTGPKSYTGGCVAVPQKKMKKVMQNVTQKTRICIF